MVTLTLVKSPWGDKKCAAVSLSASPLGGKQAHGHIFTPKNYLIRYTDKKENQIFLIYKEIQKGAVAKSY